MAITGGYVSLSMRDVLTDYLADEGQDAMALLGPRPIVKRGELARYPVKQLAADLHTAKVALDKPLIALEAGQTVKPKHLGVLGYVVQHCRTLAEAQVRLERYSRLIYDGNVMEFELDETETIISWGVQQGHHGADVDEFLLTVLVAYGRSIVTEHLNPSRVELINPKPAKLQPYHQFFGCTPTFEADTTRIGLKTSQLLSPLISPDEAQCVLLDAEASQALALLPNANGLDADLRNALLPMIRRNDIKLDQLAQQLDCSARTLQRKLAKTGQSFQEVLDELRFDLASVYMSRPELEIVDVALLCGFSEHSAFTRAFTRWAGMPPSDFRKKVGQD